MVRTWNRLINHSSKHPTVWNDHRYGGPGVILYATTGGKFVKPMNVYTLSCRMVMSWFGSSSTSDF